MASITKSPTSGYRVQWREDGSRKQRRFKTAAEAKKFAAWLELSPIQKRSTIKVADLIDEYRNTETVEKRGSREEYFRMGRLMQRPFAQKTLSEITSIDIEQYLKERRKEPSCKYNRTISSTTLIRELSALSVVFPTPSGEA